MQARITPTREQTIPLAGGATMEWTEARVPIDGKPAVFEGAYTDAVSLRWISSCLPVTWLLSTSGSVLWLRCRLIESWLVALPSDVARTYQREQDLKSIGV